MQDSFHKIIKEICEENKIEYTVISKEWVIMLTKGTVTRFITGYKFDLNNHGVGLVLDDKFATYELLNKKGLPSIEHNIVYRDDNTRDYAYGCKGIEYVKNLFKKYNKNIVLKENRGTCGNSVYYIDNELELKKRYNEMTEKYYSFSVCPYYEIESEFRAIVLNGKVELLYKKIKPIVVGDGIKTIRELLLDFNYEYFKDINLENLDTVLVEGQKFQYDWKFNLSRGAKVSENILEEDKKKVINISLNAAKLIGVKFGSIDIVKTKDNNFFILEINSGIMTQNYVKQVENGYQIVKKIYEKAIKAMF